MSKPCQLFPKCLDSVCYHLPFYRLTRTLFQNLRKSKILLSCHTFVTQAEILLLRMVLTESRHEPDSTWNTRPNFDEEAMSADSCHSHDHLEQLLSLSRVDEVETEDSILSHQPATAIRAHGGGGGTRALLSSLSLGGFHQVHPQKFRF